LPPLNATKTTNLVLFLTELTAARSGRRLEGLALRGPQAPDMIGVLEKIIHLKRAHIGHKVAMKPDL